MKPLTFSGEDEIVDELLKATSWQDNVEKDHGKLELKHELDLGPLTAIYRSVSSTTYRAFRKNGNTQPSVVFRTWAVERLYSGAFVKLEAVQTNRWYRDWAIDLGKDLDAEWDKRLGYRLELPRALKLVNLLAKGLCAVFPLWPKKYKKIAPHMDVPLDKFSLRPLACIQSLTYLKLHNASMGSIRNLEDYKKVQDVIRALCKKAGVFPLTYDYLTWNSTHPKSTAGRMAAES
ncbi:MAG TPA: hypothetical protein VIW68_05295 [Candidatus Sulfotelmatobacter sp.]